MPSLGTTFGRGAATTAQWDIANSNCVVIMGSNMAEAHPIAFRFAMQAREKGAKIIHIDPRFTRTSALADIYAPVRSGSDIAFVGGLINYVLEHDAWFKDYALHYTNIATIIHEGYQDTSELDGLFSGWSEVERCYNTETWQYAGQPKPEAESDKTVQTGEAYSDRLQRQQAGPPPTDPTLQNPRCVYQILRRHYAAYTPEMVERVTGCPQDIFLKIAETIVENSRADRTTSWCYAVGWTQHTVGVQMIRAAAILQALLGNIGRPGGGILALRGHSTIQGSTDIPTLYNLLPGYLPQPSIEEEHRSFQDYIHAERSPYGWWWNFPKYAVSLLRAWYGDRATPDNEWGYQWLPKISGDLSQLPMTLAIDDGVIRGLFVPGQNPAVGGHDAHLIRMSLPNLEWMVVRDTFESETASFWYKSPEVVSGELRPDAIQTEVFLMPAALPGEKEGTFTNTHRLIQYHDAVVEPPGDCRSELWFYYYLGKRLKELYADSANPWDEPLQALTWDYPTLGPLEEPDAEAVLKEINGYTWPDRQQIPDFKELKDDGTTACGCWIYTGVFPRNDFNKARQRQSDGPDGPGTHLGWAFAWPSNRRIMYNRASADPEGNPWAEDKRYVWWDAAVGKWTGYDEVEFSIDKPPSYEPDWSQDPHGIDAHDGCSPFMMIGDGKASLFVPNGLKDGPLPAHYEPVETPVKNPIYEQQENPVAKLWPREGNFYHAVGDPRFPYVITTFRLTEHHAGGIPTRMVPTTAELQPEAFVEIPPELAAEKGIQHMEYVQLSTLRGDIIVRAMITERLRPFRINGRLVYQIGVPWHFGWEGYATGDSANTLSAIVGDANTSIHEAKAFTCDLRKLDGAGNGGKGAR